MNKNLILIVFLPLMVSNAIFTQFYIRSPDNRIQVSNLVLEKAKKDYAYLNKSELFVTKNIKNNAFVKANFKKKKGQEVNLKTEDKRFVRAFYFNRGKDKIIVMAPGFGSSVEVLAPMIEIFSDYDLLLVNYWGMGKNLAEDKSVTAWYRNPAQRYFSERFQREERDILAAVKFVRDKKNYKQVVGLAQCYSTFTYSKAQVTSQKRKIKCFDKLIFDGCWYSAYSVGMKITDDPYMCCDQTNGGSPRLIRWVLKPKFIKLPLIKFFEIVCSLDLKSVSIIPYIKNIKNVPILFIHATNDLMVTHKEFEEIWKVTSTNKAAFITPYKHTINHLKGKEIYKYTCEQFIKAPAGKKLVYN